MAVKWLARYGVWVVALDIRGRPATLEYYQSEGLPTPHGAVPFPSKDGVLLVYDQFSDACAASANLDGV